MNSHSLISRLVAYGFAIWLAGTLLLRLRGQDLLHADSRIWTVVLLVVSFGSSAWLVRRVCRRLRLAEEQWLAGAVSLLLPTLLLDPFSSAFFPAVFPNIPANAAGVFGGWMLCCCAGGLMGVMIHR